MLLVLLYSPSRHPRDHQPFIRRAHTVISAQRPVKQRQRATGIQRIYSSTWGQTPASAGAEVHYLGGIRLVVAHPAIKRCLFVITDRFTTKTQQESENDQLLQRKCHLQPPTLRLCYFAGAAVSGCSYLSLQELDGLQAFRVTSSFPLRGGS